MANPYVETAIRTASPVALVVQMYDGALRHVAAAREHQAAGRVRERGAAISRAIAIVGELRSSLDFGPGAEIARNLDALYAFTVDRLLAANLHADAQALADVAAVLAPLREAFAELARRPPEPPEPSA